MTPFKNKTLATLLAALGGSFGLHRFYLHGLSDWRVWIYPVVLLAGMLGALLWLPALIVSLAVTFTGFIEALVFALTPDAKWDTRWNSGSGRENDSGWAVIIIAILTLAISATLFMSLLAIGLQTYFEQIAV